MPIRWINGLALFAAAVAAECSSSLLALGQACQNGASCESGHCLTEICVQGSGTGCFRGVIAKFLGV